MLAEAVWRCWIIKSAFFGGYSFSLSGNTFSGSAYEWDAELVDKLEEKPLSDQALKKLEQS